MRTNALLVLGSALALGLAACDRQSETAAPSSSRGDAASASSGATSQSVPQPMPQVKPGPAAGADHADSISPQHEPSAEEKAEKMPLPGQANDHSTTARETTPSGAEDRRASGGTEGQRQ